MVERRVIDGEQLGALAPGVESVPHGDGAEEHPQPEQRPVGDAQRGARHAHGVKVQHGAARPRADAALGAAKLHGLLALAAGGRDAEEGAGRVKAHAQALRTRHRHDVRHGRQGRRRRARGGGGARWGGRCGHRREVEQGMVGRVGTSALCSRVDNNFFFPLGEEGVLTTKIWDLKMRMLL